MQLIAIIMKIFYSCLAVFVFVWTSFAQFPAPYCAVSFNSGNEPITLVQFADIDNTSSSALIGAISHQDFTAISGNVTAGFTYPITINGNTNGNFSNVITVYIDWNQDNDFSDTGESYIIGNIINNSGNEIPISNIIDVPLNAINGTTRMRVIKKYNSAGLACNTTGFGQAEDYTINVTAAADCSGSPIVGAVSANVASICNGKPFNLTADVTPTLGYSYQWQMSTDNEATWVSLGGAQNTANYLVNSQNISSSYRLLVTCSNSDLSTTSNSIVVSQQEFSECYCINEIDYNCDEGASIINVTFSSINNDSGCSAGSGYTNYSQNVMAATIEKGSNEIISVTIDSGENANQIQSAGVWIDYNHNGIFDEEEYTFIGAGLDQVLTHTVLIPSDAMEGSTRMRVILRTSQSGNLNADMVCGPVSDNDALGEAEDYTINIVPFLGTQSFNQNSISIYPNPTTSQVTIDLDKQMNLLSVGVYSLSGQQVFSENVNINTSTHTLNVERLAAGVYMVKLTTDLGTFTQRLMKK